MQAALISITDETNDGLIKSFRFRTPRPLGHLAGQFTEVYIPHDQPDKRGIMRQFTISSAPADGDEASITVNFRGARSTYKQALAVLKPGDEFRVDEPMGDFVLPLSTDTPLVWIAGGIGITPFLSMAAQLKADGEKRDITLFHNFNGESVSFKDTSEETGIVLHLADSATQDRFTAEDIIKATQPDRNTQFYVSGPEDMVRDMRRSLSDHDIDDFNIVTDAFLGYS